MKKSDYKKLIEEQKDSGLSVKDFCFNQGISPATFYRWRKIINEKENPQGFIPILLNNKDISKDAADLFLGLNTKNDNLRDSMEFTFPNGTQLKLTGNIDVSMSKAIIHPRTRGYVN